MNSNDIEAIYNLSPMQQGMLFHTIYAPDSGVYVVQFCQVIPNDLNEQHFKRAWEEVVSRHPILRTAFAWKNLDKPLQIVGRLRLEKS